MNLFLFLFLFVRSFTYQNRSLNDTTNNASFWICSINIGGLDSVDGIATGYELDGPGFECQ
jgi:hypothetical protein